jgi:hypothetical protein
LEDVTIAGPAFDALGMPEASPIVATQLPVEADVVPDVQYVTGEPLQPPHEPFEPITIHAPANGLPG